jgi:hypothetical protein
MFERIFKQSLDGYADENGLKRILWLAYFTVRKFVQMHKLLRAEVHHCAPLHH